MPPARPRPQKAARRFKLDPGAALLGGLCMMLVCGALLKENVVRTVPSFAPLYKAMGMKVNIRGLEFAHLSLTRETANGEPVLVIKGSIANLSPAKRAVPPLKVILRSPTGTEIQAVTAMADSPEIDNEGEVTFKTVLANPPQDAKDVLVRFTGANS